MSERRSAIALAALGDAALPDIDQALDAVGNGKSTFVGLHWLELAYARIKGPAAYDRLRGLELDSKLGSEGLSGDYSGRLGLDRAIALSLGFTSFVSAPEQPVRNYRACRFDVDPRTTMLSLDACPSGTRQEPLQNMQCPNDEEPREALDIIIRALERNDDFSFKARLGPDAKAALDSILSNRSWNELRAGLLENESAGDFALGYRFEGSGRWSEPPEALDYREPSDTRPEPMLAAHFKTRSGADCGTHWVRFLLTPSDGPVTPWTPYVVNDPDIGELMRLVGACAAAK